ncbi:T9SS type A sorting domain-containing protein [Chryseobacterium flavum]|uniref:T9SS type A sorting domain-containing protein n=1 Tax=Chryseobacterium flavum TaxID=415851 RepID=UPI0028AA9125|nr:T9SS type A sorting domain-containing protein [Chryseobacterium flavum]
MKKLITLCSISIIFSSIIHVNAQQEVIIGTGTDYSFYLPINRVFEHGASEMIYDSSDINTMGIITAIGWHIDLTGWNVPTKNASIYMKTADQDTITSNVDLTDYTLVYSGNIANNNLGWQNIPLTTPFSYTDSTKNLMTLVVHNSGDYTTSTFPRFNYTTASGKASYYYNAAASWDATKTMTTTNTRPNIKLYFGQNLNTIEPVRNGSLKYYPNPINNTVTITDIHDIDYAEVYNLSGIKLISKKIGNKEVSLDISNLPSGNYLIKVIYRNDSWKTIKVIKK